MPRDLLTDLITSKKSRGCSKNFRAWAHMLLYNIPGVVFPSSELPTPRFRRTHHSRSPERTTVTSHFSPSKIQHDFERKPMVVLVQETVGAWWITFAAMWFGVAQRLRWRLSCKFVLILAALVKQMIFHKNNTWHNDKWCHGTWTCTSVA